MKKSARRILALALSLVLICTLAATVFASTIVRDNDQTTIDDVRVDVALEVDDTTIRAITSISGNVSTATGVADVGMTYTYCSEDNIRPSYYQTGRRSGTLFVYEEIRSASLTKNVGSGYVVIDATAQFVVDVTTPNVTAEYAPDPLHVDYY